MPSTNVSGMMHPLFLIGGLREAEVIGEKTLPPDSVIWLMLGAGNRDLERFHLPNNFDITRKDIKHLALWRRPPHFCLGNQFAKAEGIAARAIFIRAKYKIKRK